MGPAGQAGPQTLKSALSKSNSKKEKVGPKELRFSNKDEIHLIPKENPLLFLTTPTEHIKSCLENTAKKLSRGLESMRSDCSGSGLEKAVWNHAVLASCGIRTLDKTKIVDTLRQSIHTIKDIIKAVEEFGPEHPFVDNLTLYLKEISKLINISEPKTREVVEVLYRKLRRMYRADRLNFLTNSDLYFEILLRAHDIFIPERTEEDFKIVDVMAQRSTNFYIAEYEADPNSDCLRLDVAGNCLFQAAARLSRGAVLDYLLDKMTPTSVDSSGFFTLVSIGFKLDRSVKLWRKIIELKLRSLECSSRLSAEELFHSTSEGTFEFSINLTSNMVKNSQSTTCTIQKQEDCLSIEIDSAIGTSTHLLVTKLGSSYRIYKKGKRGIFHELSSVTQVPSYFDLSTQVQHYLNLKPAVFFKLLTMSIIPTAESVPLTPAKNFIGMKSFKRFLGVKAMKYRYHYQLRLNAGDFKPSSTKEDTQPESSTDRNMDDYLDAAFRKSLFPFERINKLRQMSEETCEARYIEFVDFLLSKHKSRSRPEDISMYAKWLQSLQPDVVSHRPSVWIAQEPTSSLSAPRLPWACFRLVSNLCAFIDLELLPVAIVLNSQNLSHLADSHIMALKVKLEKTDRYLCELTSWQPSAAPRIDIGNIKLAECRDFSTADTPYGESTNDRHSSRTIPSLVGSSVFPTTKSQVQPFASLSEWEQMNKSQVSEAFDAEPNSAKFRQTSLHPDSPSNQNKHEDSQQFRLRSSVEVMIMSHASQSKSGSVQLTPEPSLTKGICDKSGSFATTMSSSETGGTIKNKFLEKAPPKS